MAFRTGGCTDFCKKSFNIYLKEIMDQDVFSSPYVGKNVFNAKSI